MARKRIVVRGVGEIRNGNRVECGQAGPENALFPLTPTLSRGRGSAFARAFGRAEVENEEPDGGCNPVGVEDVFGRSPRVARASQPWTERCNPFGIVRVIPLYWSISLSFGLRTSWGSQRVF